MIRKMDTSCSIASDILNRGVALDLDKRYSEALVCYQEGIQILINVAKKEVGDKAAYFRTKIEEYMSRAEKVKTIISELKLAGKYHEKIEIKNNATGYSYSKVFGRFLDEDVKEVTVEDPYIRNFHQVQNLVRLCELIVKKCKNIKRIRLITKKEADTEQLLWLQQLEKDLYNHNVIFLVDFSESLHDRKIVLGNGWIIQIGRGLDYFKPTESKFSLGINDMDFRKCHETTIDVYHSTSITQVT